MKKRKKGKALVMVTCDCVAERRGKLYMPNMEVVMLNGVVCRDGEVK
jgi:hypothetical protein